MLKNNLVVTGPNVSALISFLLKTSCFYLLSQVSVA